MKTIAALILSAAALAATGASAQTSGPGEDKAAASAKATAAEKADAKKARIAQGKSTAKMHAIGDDVPSTTASPRQTKEARKAAALKRRAAARANKPAKDATGPN